MGWLIGLLLLLGGFAYMAVTLLCSGIHDAAQTAKLTKRPVDEQSVARHMLIGTFAIVIGFVVLGLSCSVV